MFIASEKRKTNISEYLIYMFQIEDIIRSLNFDINKIEEVIIQKHDLPYGDKRDMREWYLSLIRHLQDNGLHKKGHCPFLQNIINELDELHLKLLSDSAEINKYQYIYNSARGAIEDLRNKSGTKNLNDIQLCLEGLYGLFLLRLSGKKINPETEEAFGLISKMLAYLSARFNETDEGLAEL